ncbi:hypothetical protein XENTR_v10017266 [Xenopus tropicalis]|nr:hypothetical protein XENTR_v10017266 [Xenopus tropicalis]
MRCLVLCPEKAVAQAGGQHYVAPYYFRGDLASNQAKCSAIYTIYVPSLSFWANRLIGVLFTNILSLSLSAVQKIQWMVTILAICVLLVLETLFFLWYCDWHQRREKEKRLVRNLSKKQMSAILLKTLRLK